MTAQKSMDAKKVRRLIADERKFLWNPLSNVTIVARITGNFSQERLKAAISKAKKMHVLLSSRVVYDKDNTAWFVSDENIDIPLRVAERRHEGQWQEEMMHENRIPVNIFGGPLIRFVLIKSEKESDFMAYCQHAVCDGRALSYLIRDILALAKDPDIKINELKLPPVLSAKELSQYSPPKKTFKATLSKLIIKKTNKKWLDDMVLFDQEDFENIHKAYWQDHEYKLETLELNNEETGRLVAGCKKHGVSVNSLLSVAFLAAHHNLFGPFEGSHKNVGLPVDLRNRIKEPAEEALCYYINRILFSFEYSAGEGIWQNAKRFDDIVKAELAKVNYFDSMIVVDGMEPTLFDAITGFGTLAETVPPGFSRYDKLSEFAKKEKNPAIRLAKRFLNMSPGMVMTNLGKLDFENDYGDFRLEKLFFAPSTDKRFPLVIGALTAKGKLVATINYVDEKRKPSNAEKMSKVAKHALEFIKL